ncbi:SMI1/KNR4 family protein [Nonomuraea sp. NPDC049758]|uniref:SMI1/KNR4 family protein n=1 Tax=Nonomuraea sp. NPDC049758 TaxID=3154360 RepID=UPI0034339667
MLKLVRQALTAAVLIALAVRLRRRARLPRAEPPPSVPAPAPRRRRAGTVLSWLVIAVVVTLTLGFALMGTSVQRGALALVRAVTEQQEPPPAGPEPVTPVTPMTAVTPAEQPAEPVATVQPTPAASAAQAPNCAPRRRPIDPRRVAPDVKRAVDAQWRRIERWLRSNAPRTYRTLGGPVRARTIAVAESQMGVDFPDALRASLLRHNGARGAGVLGFRSEAGDHLTVRGIRDAWREMCARRPAGAWDGLLIPILSYTTFDGDTAYATVSSADGTVSGVTGRRLRSSYTLLRTVADALERGGAIDGRRPVVTGGVLRWKPAR